MIHKGISIKIFHHGGPPRTKVSCEWSIAFWGKVEDEGFFEHGFTLTEGPDHRRIKVNFPLPIFSY
jgi:hypothetical protein